MTGPRAASFPRLPACGIITTTQALSRASSWHSMRPVAFSAGGGGDVEQLEVGQNGRGSGKDLPRRVRQERRRSIGLIETEVAYVPPDTIVLLSAGIDIGTATSQMLVSRIVPQSVWGVPTRVDTSWTPGRRYSTPRWSSLPTSTMSRSTPMH